MKILNTLVLTIYLLLGAVSHSAVASLPELNRIQGMDVLGAGEVNVSAQGKKGLVVVFLSAVCPCSNSHVAELKALASDYPQFAFVGVHSNGDENAEIAKSYFAAAELPFPVVQDNEFKIADAFRAIKTPHAFLVDAGGKLLYKGGVSSSHEFKMAERKYLREALADVQANRPIKTAEARTLGCIISRRR